MGRINWLFLGSDNGGQTAAVLFSFTATCKHLRMDTFAYLRDVLGRLPTHPSDRLEDLLPHRWQSASQPVAATPNAPAQVTRPRHEPFTLPTKSIHRVRWYPPSIGGMYFTGREGHLRFRRSRRDLHLGPQHDELCL